MGTNRVTLVRFAIPVVADPTERIRRVKELTSEWRNGRAPALTDVLAKCLNTLPGPIPTSIFGRLLKSVDFVATNVPGSTVPIYLAGAEVTACSGAVLSPGSTRSWGWLRADALHAVPRHHPETPRCTSRCRPPALAGSADPR